MKKHLEKTIPESTKQLPISFLRSEIEYLRGKKYKNPHN